jgi:hypothetical protein
MAEGEPDKVIRSGTKEIVNQSASEGDYTNDTLDVEIEAEDEVDRRFVWRCRLSCAAPIHPMALAWAEAHGVSASAVGFEDMEDNIIDTSQTPNQLGWTPNGGMVRLRAIPVDMQYAEGSGKRPGETEATTSAGDGPSRGTTGRQATVSCEETVDTAPPTAATGTPAVAEDAPTTVSGKRKQPAPVPPAAADEASGPPAAKKAKDASAPAPKAKGKAKAKAKAEPGTEATPSAKASARSESSAAPKAKAAPATSPPASRAVTTGGSDGPMPGDDEPIVFEQENPKKKGAAAHIRYEKYKAAKTPRDAMALGASKGDVGHDFKKGFMRRA